MSRWAGLAALLLLVAACGGIGSGQTSPSSASSSPAASASPKASGSKFDFTISGVSNPAKGTITLTSTGTSVTIEIKVGGLAANSTHISHVHIGSCTQRGSIAFALNSVVADATGAADARTTFQAHYPPSNGHWYVVVHAGPDMQGSNAQYLLCGNLFK
jgi:Cu/Zn superoxide dismutase